ncbi:MAG: hypothetical protein ABIQ74_00680 [Chitinophagales bacterium]
MNNRKNYFSAGISFFPSVALVILVFCFTANCNSSYTPKPRGYFKIVFPEKSYQHFDNGVCPFEFEFPKYGLINSDTVFLDTVPDNECWFNITFPSLNGNLYLSYKQIDEKHSLDRLISDSHELTFKHTVKADFIDENILQTPGHVSGILFDVGGNAASALQFYVTDSSKHFLRGSLYFYNTPNADSIAPVLQFLRPDVLHLISTLKWK